MMLEIIMSCIEITAFIVIIVAMVLYLIETKKEEKRIAQEELQEGSTIELILDLRK